MGNQSQFLEKETPAYEAGMSVRTTETVEYITGLLGELEIIAALSGLSHLSDDIQSVLTKHKIEAFEA